MPPQVAETPAPVHACEQRATQTWSPLAASVVRTLAGPPVTAAAIAYWVRSSLPVFCTVTRPVIESPGIMLARVAVALAPLLLVSVRVPVENRLPPLAGAALHRA